MARKVLNSRLFSARNFILVENIAFRSSPLLVAAKRYATLSTNRISMKNIITLLLAFLLISCQKEKPKEEIKFPKKTKSVVEKENLKLIDTTIILTNIESSEDCAKITEMEAEKFLYKYFRTQGAIPRNEIKDYSKDNLCIDYDTIYNLKSDKTCFAIIRYWLKSADLNGTCVQPSMAIISKTKKGLKITNEEFVNSDFGIDSIAKNQIVYGYKYDCSEHKVVKNYRLKLETK